MWNPQQAGCWMMQVLHDLQEAEGGVFMWNPQQAGCWMMQVLHDLQEAEGC